MSACCWLLSCAFKQLFLKYSVQNLYCYWWECYADTTYSVITESQTLTQNVLKESKWALFLYVLSLMLKIQQLKHRDTFCVRVWRSTDILERDLVTYWNLTHNKWSIANKWVKLLVYYLKGSFGKSDVWK